MSKLEELLNYVAKNNNFYKSIIKEYGITNPTDITQYPVLTRQQLQKNRYTMFSDGYKSKYFSQLLRRQSSSGSSGVPVNVYWDYKDWYASNLSLWRKRLKWYGIYPSDKYVMFTLNAFNIVSDGKTVYYANNMTNILSINMSLIQNESGYDKLIDIINDFEPKWLYIQPFVLDKLIRAYKRTGKKPPQTLKYIESIGELLTSDLRRRAEDFFQTAIANMYGSEEMNGIAYECPQHHLHILDDNVMIEIRDNNKIQCFGEGETIITNLNNFAFPLIRYNQGDRILVNKCVNLCKCGSASPVITMIMGRESQSVEIKNINPFILSEVIAETNNQFNDIIESYRYVYRRLNHELYCYITINKDNILWFESLRKTIETIFYNKINNQQIIDFNVVLENENKFNISKNKVLEVKE